MQDKTLLNSLMRCYDTELNEEDKNDIGVRVMYMFNLARATQNEQRVEDLSWVGHPITSISVINDSLSELTRSH